MVPRTDADNPALDPTTVLNSFGEARSINYLARWPAGRDPSMVEPASTPVGNPTVWNLGAQAYSMLLLQNPTYAAQVSTSRAAQIEAEGTRIADLAASFGRPVDGNANSLITGGLIDEYVAATNELSTALAAFRTNEIQARWEPDANGVQVKVLKNYDLFWDTDKPLARAPTKVDEATVPACDGSRQIDRPSNVRYDLMSNMVQTLQYAYTPRLGEPPAGVRDGVARGRLPLHAELGPHPDDGQRRRDPFLRQAAVADPQPVPAELVHGLAELTDRRLHLARRAGLPRLLRVLQLQQRDHPRAGPDPERPSGRYAFASAATAINNTALDTSLTPTLRGFLQARQKSLYDRVRELSTQVNGPVPTALKKMNTSARLLQAYTRLGLPNALDSDDVLSANLFGQYQIPVNMPTDAKIGNAYAKAGGNYALCGPAPCSPDTSRPLRDQVSLKLPCEPAVDSSNLPGDPLGDCLITSARSRAERAHPTVRDLGGPDDRRAAPRTGAVAERHPHRSAHHHTPDPRQLTQALPAPPGAGKVPSAAGRGPSCRATGRWEHVGVTPDLGESQGCGNGLDGFLQPGGLREDKFVRPAQHVVRGVPAAHLRRR